MSEPKSAIARFAFDGGRVTQYSVGFLGVAGSLIGVYAWLDPTGPDG